MNQQLQFCGELKHVGDAVVDIEAEGQIVGEVSSCCSDENDCSNLAERSLRRR